MYKEANEKITQGLSLGARLILGSVSGIFGSVFILMGGSAEKPIGHYLVGSFCLLIFIACVTSGRFRQFIGSTIGSVMVLVGVAYLLDEILAGKLISSARGEPSAVNAIFYLIFIGIPGVTYAYKARFGFGKKP